MRMRTGSMPPPPAAIDVRPAPSTPGAEHPMSESVLLFPYLDVAMRAVAVLILCALPLLLMSD